MPLQLLTAEDLALDNGLHVQLEVWTSLAERWTDLGDVERASAARFRAAVVARQIARLRARWDARLLVGQGSR